MSSGILPLSAPIGNPRKHTSISADMVTATLSVLAWGETETLLMTFSVFKISVNKRVAVSPSAFLPPRAAA